MKATQPMKTIFNRLVVPESHSDDVPIEHLKPLSVYSRIVICDSETNLSPSLFCNLNVEFVNNTLSKKRGADDSFLDDTFETPAKKTNCPNTAFPGLPSNSIDTLQKVNSFNTPHDSLLDGLETISSLNNLYSVEFEKPQIDLECVDGSSLRASDSGGGDKTVPNSVGSYSLSERVKVNSGPVFDFNVENILCLSPINCTVQHEEMKKCPRNNWPLNNAVVVKSQVPGQDLSERAKSGDLPGDVLEKVAGCEVANGVAYQGEADKNYFSSAYLAMKRESNLQAESAVVQSTPNIITRTKGEVLQDKKQCHTEHDHNDQAVDINLNGAPLCSVNNEAGTLDGDVEDVSSFGTPIFESTVCHGDTVGPSEGTEKISQLVGSSLLSSLQDWQTTVDGKSTLNTSYETTLPLQVQVKSVVVVPNLPSVGSTSKELPQPMDDLIKQSQPQSLCSKPRLTNRPVIFDSEATWQYKKMEYVQSVKRHMLEGRRHAGQGPINELHNLMSRVADERPGADGSQWQNPLDLTKRNYQRRFGNMKPSMSLTEWQIQNSRSHKRFADVKKDFRSTV